jgi:pyruvate formate lyase activating enzyme
LTLRFGLQKTTLIDYPGRVAALLFTAGCNFRCPYCHNPELVRGNEPDDFHDFAEIMIFLKKRRAVLGGVAISGGEPLLQPELPEAVAAIRELGLAVKLDTNGSLPEALKAVKPDFIAMDIKTSFRRYDRLLPETADAKAVVKRMVESIEYILGSGTPHEFRTTMVPGIVAPEDFDEILPSLQGAQSWILSGFRNGLTLDPVYTQSAPYPKEILYEAARRIEKAGIPARVRLNP